MIEPETIEVTGRDGKPKTFVLSKLPATVGREVAAKYPVAILPKLGDYAVSEATMLLLMSYVGVPRDGGNVPLMLTTKALVDSHVTDAEMLLKLEMAMLERNFSFFGNGKTWDFFATIAEQAKAWITSTLTDSLAASSRTTKRRSKNSGRSTR